MNLMSWQDNWPARDLSIFATSKHCLSAEKTEIQYSKKNHSQRHCGCPQFNGFFLHLLWPWFAGVFDQRLCGVWRKDYAPYFVCQTKSFRRGWRIFLQIIIRNTNREKNRRSLAKTARMHLLVNHQHMELWNMTKNLRRLYLYTVYSSVC